MEQIIIDEAKKIAETDFMKFPDYDAEQELGFVDAMTIILFDSMYGNDEVESDKLYDFLNTRLNNTI